MEHPTTVYESDAPALSDAATACQESIHGVMEIIWKAIPFLDAIGDSFKALARDPFDDIGSRDVIPAHVKALLSEAVTELGSIREDVRLLDLSQQIPDAGGPNPLKMAGIAID